MAAIFKMVAMWHIFAKLFKSIAILNAKSLKLYIWSNAVTWNISKHTISVADLELE
jgi:hypothetical protein